MPSRPTHELARVGGEFYHDLTANIYFYFNTFQYANSRVSLRFLIAIDVCQSPHVRQTCGLILVFARIVQVPLHHQHACEIGQVLPALIIRCSEIYHLESPFLLGPVLVTVTTLDPEKILLALQ